MLKKHIFQIIIFAILPISVMAQEVVLRKGRVTDGLKINDSLKESFAVYLPQDYDESNPPGVLFILEPDGEGRTALQLFRKAAEEQSYVVAASNQKFQSDSIQENLLKSVRFINALYQTIRVNPKLTYVAGKGKAAQVAMALPLVNKGINGVLPINDAWINTEYFEKLENKFAVSGIAGTKDYNQYIIKNILEFLEDHDHPTEFNYFEGGPQEWPDTNTLYNAVALFTLKAIKDNKRPPDSILVDKLFENELQTIESLRRQRSYYTAWVQRAKLEDKYEDYDRFKDRLKTLKKDLRRNKAFREQRRTHNTLVEEEILQQEDYRSFLETDIYTNNFENIGWWAEQFDKLEKGKKHNDLLERNMAYRLDAYLKMLIDSTYRSLDKGDSRADMKIFIAILKTVADQKDPAGYLSIIRIAGHDGDNQTALLYLEDLLKTGFDDIDALYDIEGILDLKLSEEYNTLIKEYLGEAKYLNF